MESGTSSDFGPALLEGLAQLGPVDAFSGDLSLELGISVWLRQSGTSLLDARSCLLEVRRAILAVCGLDPTTEPVPFVGRSPRLDVITLVAYVGDLLRRASAGADGGLRGVVARVVAELPAPAARGEALGA
jgi:hypothetical protein